MGQYLGIASNSMDDSSEKTFAISTFEDLRKFPPEVALQILSNLNATELCLAACVWKEMADSEFLWQSLCYKTWGYLSAYLTLARDPCTSYKKLYMILDEASVTFNVDPQKGLNLLFDHDLLVNDPYEIALFIYSTKMLRSDSKRTLFRRW